MKKYIFALIPLWVLLLTGCRTTKEIKQTSESQALQVSTGTTTSQEQQQMAAVTDRSKDTEVVYEYERWEYPNKPEPTQDGTTSAVLPNYARNQQEPDDGSKPPNASAYIKGKVTIKAKSQEAQSINSNSTTAVATSYATTSENKQQQKTTTKEKKGESYLTLVLAMVGFITIVGVTAYLIAFLIDKFHSVRL